MIEAKKYLPAKQLVSDNKNSSWVEYSTYAIERNFISMNHPEHRLVKWLMVDCDHEDYDYLPGSFPTPIATVVTPESGRHHHIWHLDTPVLTGTEARFKPQKLLKAVERAFVWHLGGDEAYSNRLTKNPWKTDKWHTIWHPKAKPIDLAKCVDWIEEEPSRDKFKVKRPDPRLGFGRNVGVFDMLRLWAYDNYRNDHDEVYAMCRHFDSLYPDPVPLPESEIKSISKSVCNFMDTKYEGKKKGVVKRLPKLILFQNILNFEKRFQEEFEELPNQKVIAEQTKIPYRSVKRYMSEIARQDITLQNLKEKLGK